MEELVVASGVVAALLVPPGEVAEFDLEDGGLDGVEAGVPADLVVIVAAAHAVGAEDAGVVVDGGGGGGDEAGVAHGAEIFCGVEAEGCGVAEGAGGGAVPGGSEGLGGVFDEEEVVVLFQGGECVPVGALAVEVDGEDGFDVAARWGLQELLRPRAAERLKVAGSMSARRGVAPQRRMALTVAKKLKGVVMTASPGPMLAAARASQMASVPLAQPMA